MSRKTNDLTTMLEQINHMLDRILETLTTAPQDQAGAQPARKTNIKG